MPKPKVLAPPSGQAVPVVARDLAKQELARRLQQGIMARDWNQADLARAAGVPRELVSSYMRGHSFPTPRSLRRIANALGTTPEQLLPETQAIMADDEVPAFQVTQMAGHPHKVWMRINQSVPLGTAMQIGALLSAAKENASGE